MNNEAAFICVMIVVLWAVDLLVRPLVNYLIRSIWRGKDARNTTATAKDA